MFANACHDVRVRSLTRYGKGGADGDFFELALEHPRYDNAAWKNWKPGQFVMVRPESFGLEPLMGRPFSISRADEEHGVCVFFQVVGRGTAKMARLRPGDPVALWGPLGNSFAVRDEARTLILAGGIGIAPFWEYVKRHPQSDAVHVIFGHRPPLDSYPYREMAAITTCDAHRETCSEDLERFIGLLERLIPEYCPNDLVLACGPLPFLKTVSRIATEAGGRAQLSLENRMACGIGACLGCVTEHKTQGPLSVCARGPVFWSDEINL